MTNVTTGATGPPPRAPLLLTRDVDLLDDLLRLAAAAGAEPVVLPDAGSARREWAGAPLVLLGEDICDDVVRRGLPRRQGVILVAAESTRAPSRDPDRESAHVWAQAVAVGAERVLFLPVDEPALIDRLADSVEGGGALARVVAVIGGRGGAGATTLAVALALTAVRHGRRCTLIDADPLGGGIDLALGAENTVGVRWPQLAGTRGRVDSHTLRQALPRVQELTVLSWDRSDRLSVPVQAMETVLAAARRGADLVVIDLPRRLDEAAELTLRACDLALLVVPAEVRATAAAARVSAAVGMVASRVQVVVRGPAPSHLRAHEVADALGLPLAGTMDAEPHIAEQMDRGEPPGRRDRGPLARLCRELLESPPLQWEGPGAPGRGGRAGSVGGGGGLEGVGSGNRNVRANVVANVVADAVATGDGDATGGYSGLVGASGGPWVPTTAAAPQVPVPADPYRPGVRRRRSRVR